MKITEDITPESMKVAINADVHLMDMEQLGEDESFRVESSDNPPHDPCYLIFFNHKEDDERRLPVLITPTLARSLVVQLLREMSKLNDAVAKAALEKLLEEITIQKSIREN